MHFFHQCLSGIGCMVQVQRFKGAVIIHGDATVVEQITILGFINAALVEKKTCMLL
jgi:hypothetical protein